MSGPDDSVGPTPGLGIEFHPAGSEIGRMLAPVVGHVRKRSALRQAKQWNEVLRHDTPAGAQPAYVVEVVKSKADGFWRLEWRPHQAE